MGVFINASSEFGLSCLWYSRTHKLRIRLRSIVNEVLVEYQTSALQKIDWLLTMENEAPFTSNEPYFMSYRENFLNLYRGSRIRDCEGPDPYDKGLRYMASARAYFQGLPRFLSSTSSRLLTTSPFSYVQAFHGYGPDSDRSGVVARIGPGRRALFCLDEAPRDHWTRQPEKSQGVHAGAAGCRDSQGEFAE